MNTRTIAIDLAKDIFEVAIADEHWRIISRHRLNRSQMVELMAQQPVSNVVMEACGTAHHWGRTFTNMGHHCCLLPAQYVRPYRRRNKTDRADTEAILEASRCEGIVPVPIKSIDQQQLQLLHRLREQWKTTRTARINGLRGICRELGIDLPKGAKAGIKAIHAALGKDLLSEALRAPVEAVLCEIEMLEIRIQAIEKRLQELTRDNEAVHRLRQIPGIGLLISTAMIASAGSPHHFKSGRHLAAWLGVTPRESSSGHRRHLGHISKQGDVYLRMLLIHGARSVLARAKQLARSSLSSLSPLYQWVLSLERRVGHNKATVALANKLARIAWAVWRHQTNFDPQYAEKVAA